MFLSEFRIFKDKAGEFRFNLHSKGNHEVILRSSEGYTTKQNCHKGIESVKSNAPIDERYKRDQASNGQYYFVLNARNGEPIGVSEMYTTQSARDNGIEAVKRDAPNASVKDLTQSSTTSTYRY